MVKRLPKFSALPYTERLKHLNLLSLELQCLRVDLICCYKILFGLTDLQAREFFETAPLPITRGHKYKLYEKHSSSTVQAKFYSERIVNVWNNLKDIADFSTLTSFIRTFKIVDLSEHLRHY